MNMENKQDIRIAGSGTACGGDYQEVKISGSGKVNGFVRCETLKIAGFGRLCGVECAAGAQVSGSAHFEGDVRADRAHVSGACKVTGELQIREALSISGAVRVGKSVTCTELTCSGVLHADGDVEAESVGVTGNLHCKGLLNAERVEIRFSEHAEMGSVGGSHISIHPGKEKKLSILGIPVYSSLRKGSATVHTAIEGDDIDLKNVTCPRVSGRRVVIGEGCNIDLVQYGESAEISPEAKVGRQEKIG